MRTTIVSDVPASIRQIFESVVWSSSRVNASDIAAELRGFAFGPTLRLPLRQSFDGIAWQSVAIPPEVGDVLSSVDWRAVSAADAGKMTQGLKIIVRLRGIPTLKKSKA